MRHRTTPRAGKALNSASSVLNPANFGHPDQLWLLTKLVEHEKVLPRKDIDKQTTCDLNLEAATGIGRKGINMDKWLRVAMAVVFEEDVSRTLFVHHGPGFEQRHTGWIRIRNAPADGLYGCPFVVR
jgi:hypothetical protein